MRPYTSARLYYVLSLTLIIVPTLLLASEDGLLAVEAEIPSEPAVVDVCSPLYEARVILEQLKAPAYAHLESKVAGTGGPFGNRGWGDGLGWSNEGPVSTALRLLPKLLNQLLSPTRLLSHIPFLDTYTKSRSNSPAKRKKVVKITKGRRERVERVMGLLEEAEKGGCSDVWGERGKMRMFPPKGIKQDLPAAFQAYSRYLETSSDPEAQFMLAFFHSTGLGGAEMDQGKALVYYTFAALGGYRPAQMVLGYRHWAGIGVKEDCLAALEYYETSAEKAYAHFLTGPPGGLTLPLTHTRLSDRSGGIYGPHASWASTGVNAHRASVKASSAVARGETEKEVLEYYQYHSDRDSHIYTVRLGRLYYLGSVYFLPGGISSGAEGVGEIPQSYEKARMYFLRVVRNMWVGDWDSNGNVVGRRKMSKETEEGLKEPAMVAAAFLGRMALRGEGQKRDYRRAKMWFERSAELGDREAHNGLGVIHRDGLGVPVDRQKAFHYFQAAAGQDLAEAQVNLAKIHMERGEIPQAVQMLEVALRHGSPFEAFHLLSSIHAVAARTPQTAGGRPGMCGVSVAWYKLVSERGCWKDDFVGEADRAWARGEEDNAVLGWWIAGEMGYEGAQNNVAFLLDRGFVPFAGEGEEGEEERKETALRMWIRSAAQDNVDSMVRVGDYYYRSESLPPKQRYEKAASYYQTAADTQSSSMAYWNLGWMYELGQGVPQDWHLAKRFYDLSLETSDDAYLPVSLSLVGLYLRSWWIELKTNGEIKGLELYGPPRDEDEVEGIKEKGLWEKIKGLFSVDGLYDDGEGYQDHSGSGWTDIDNNGGMGEGVQGDADNEPVPRVGEEGYETRARRRVPREEEEEDELIEILAIVVVGLCTFGLVYLRGRWLAEIERRQRERAVLEAGGGGGGEGQAGVVLE